MRLDRTLAVLVAGLLAACATNTDWNKAGSTDRDFKADHGECELRIHDIPSMMVIRRNRVYEECMISKGWKKPTA